MTQEVTPASNTDGRGHFQSRALGAWVVGDGARAVRRVIGVLAPLQAGQSEQTQKSGQSPQAVVAAVVFGRLLLRLRHSRGGGGWCFEGGRGCDAGTTE